MTPVERLARLNDLIRASRAAPFYRERLPEHPLRSLDELKRIPLTTKDDLRRHSPFGLLAVPRAEVHQYHETSGTTGRPASVWFTKDDVHHNARQIARCGVRFRDTDTVLIRFPYALSAVAHMTHAAAQLSGACVVPAGGRTSVTPFPKVVDLMRRLEVTVVCCLSLQAVMIAEVAEMAGLDPRRDFPHLRAICSAGEPLSPARRALLEDIWGVPVYDFYGMTEIGTAVTDCAYFSPHPLEDEFIFEILNDTLDADAEPGEFGCLVVTALNKRATPMIRYVTGDRARRLEAPCACGQSTVLEVRGRKEDTLAAAGRLLDLLDLEAIIARLPCRRFWAAAPLPGGVHFVVEAEQGIDALPPGLVDRLEREFALKLRIDLVPRGTLYDRRQMVEVGMMGKPRYLCSQAEIMSFLQG